MNLEKIVESVKFFEFLNKVENLRDELLYSEKDGFLNLRKKEAFENVENYALKFENEFAKLSLELKMNNVEDIYDEKKEEFLKKLNAHSEKELDEWIEEVYEGLISNCLKNIEENRENRAFCSKYIKRAYLSIDWLCSVKKNDEIYKEELIKNLNEDLKNIFEKTQKLPKEKMITESDCKTYLKIRDLVLDDIEKFKQLDFTQYKNKLILSDITNFEILKNTLNTTKKTSTLDEIKLINTALDILNLKDDAEKYMFIKDIENEFNISLTNNKKLSEEEKINIVKKRILIKQNPLYYKEKLEKTI